MLEFYQAYSDYQELMAMTEALIASVAREVTGTEQVTYEGRQISLAPPYRRVSLRQAAAEAATAKGGTAVSEADLRNRETAAAVASRLEIPLQSGWGPGKIAMEMFESLVEDALVEPTFVYDFPTEVSPLSKQRPDDPETVERFELYIAGFEIANAFSELNDPAEQRRRFEDQLRQRAGGDAEAHVMDEDYIRALEYGMPPAAGEGVGIDRLVMILTNSPSIRDVILFPHMKRK
jgi:lysyl-tRNA synthetase class 2